MVAYVPLGFDTETELIRQARVAPDLVCVTWQALGEQPNIAHHTDAEAIVRNWLEGPFLLVGHNVAYDLAVLGQRFSALLPLIFAAYDADRVTDTGIRQKLLDLASGTLGGRVGSKGTWVKHEYTLEALAKRVAGIPIQKDAWRLSYGRFRDVPLPLWPARAQEVQAEAARKLASSSGLSPKEIEGLRALVEGDPNRCTIYPLEDASATLAIFQKQEVHASYLSDQYRQARAAFWLHLSSAWGLRTDAAGVEHLRRETQAAYDRLLSDLVEAKLVRPNGTRDTKAAKALMLDVCSRERIVLRRTEAHATDGESKCKALDGTKLPAGHQDCAEHISLDADACNATGDETLTAYAELSTLKKVLTNDVEALSKGTDYPVHTRYGMAETGRTTSSGPNIQNLRRKAGIREAFVPRPGKVFAAADYPALELYTLAQCCVSWLGQSKLADALNSGLDPHLALAATMLDVSYDDARARHESGEVEIDDMRQLAKLGNFGFPGGMGIPKLIISIKKQLGQINPALLERLTAQGFLSIERMKRLKEQWFATWPEMPRYFARVNALCDTSDGRASVETLFTQRIRGGASYCAACNNGFQALGSDCAKNAGWLITKSLYLDIGSPLFNSRLVAFVHDEFIIETEDREGAHDAAFELARLMCKGANAYLRDVPVALSKLKPLLMRRWSKKAKQLLNSEGRLIAWQ